MTEQHSNPPAEGRAEHTAARDPIRQARRIVIKVGSRLLATRANLIPSLAEQISRAGSDRQFMLVSSGAISLGCQKLGYEQRPQDMPRLQAAAAVGQSELMLRYRQSLADHGRVAAQVLLTHSDLASRRRLANAEQAISALLDAGAVPIINENDTVSTDEIAFGDNDQLASLVVPMVRAELLLLLTDVDGVLSPTNQRISLMTRSTPIGERSGGNPHGSGGIASKINAAYKACHSGANVVVASAEQADVIGQVLAGEDIGTWFPPNNHALRARQHWIAYTLKPRGQVLVDGGAADALRSGTNSLLPVGVVGVSGRFSRGDAVRVVGPGGVEVARGLVRLGLPEVARIAGKTSQELRTQIGELDTVVIHKDDLVLSE